MIDQLKALDAKELADRTKRRAYSMRHSGQGFDANLYDALGDRIIAMSEESAALKAENERLREAGRMIVAANGMIGAPAGDRVNAWAAAFKVLNQALGGQP